MYELAYISHVGYVNEEQPDGETRLLFRCRHPVFNHGVRVRRRSRGFSPGETYERWRTHIKIAIIPPNGEDPAKSQLRGMADLINYNLSNFRDVLIVATSAPAEIARDRLSATYGVVRRELFPLKLP